MSAPTLMKSTPVSAIARTVSSVTPPDASSSARPSTSSTAPRRRSRSMLSSRIRPAPAASASSTSASVAHSTSTVTPAGAAGQRAPGGLPHPAGQRRVVLLDQHGVVEAAPVVGAAAGAHRLLLEVAQAGRGLAGVEDPRARALHRLDEARRERGDPGEAAEEVERHPLAREDRRRRAAQLGERTRLAPAPVGGERLERERGVHAREDGLGDGQPGRHARRPLLDRGPRGSALGDHRGGGQVAGPEVLLERQGDHVQHGAGGYGKPPRLPMKIRWKARLGARSASCGRCTRGRPTPTRARTCRPRGTSYTGCWPSPRSSSSASSRSSPWTGASATPAGSWPGWCSQHGRQA